MVLGGNLSLTSATTTWQVRSVVSSPIPTLSGPANHAPVNRLIVQPRRAEILFLSASVNEGQDQFSPVLRPVRGGASSAQSYPLCLWWYQEPQTSAEPGAASESEPRHAPRRSAGPDIPVDLGGNEATHLTHSSSLLPFQLCLYPQDINILFLSVPYHSIHLLTIAAHLSVLYALEPSS